jgi:hypothetical protein
MISIGYILAINIVYMSLSEFVLGPFIESTAVSLICPAGTIGRTENIGLCSEHSCIKPDGTQHGPYSITYGSIYLIRGNFYDGKKHGSWTSLGATDPAYRDDYDVSYYQRIAMKMCRSRSPNYWNRVDEPWDGHWPASEYYQYRYLDREIVPYDRSYIHETYNHGFQIGPVWITDYYSRIRLHGEYSEGSQVGNWVVYEGGVPVKVRTYSDNGYYEWTWRDDGSIVSWGMYAKIAKDKDMLRNGPWIECEEDISGYDEMRCECGEVMDNQRTGLWTTADADFEIVTSRDHYRWGRVIKTVKNLMVSARNAIISIDVASSRDGYEIICDKNRHRGYRLACDITELCCTLNSSQGVEECKQYHNKIAIAKGKRSKGKRTGVWVYYYWDRKIHRTIEYKNGVRDGKSVTYGPDGAVLVHGRYRNNIREGEWVYSRNTFWSEIERISYRGGKRNGWYEMVYDANNRIKTEGMYIEGKKEGPWIEWEFFYNPPAMWRVEYYNDRRCGRGYRYGYDQTTLQRFGWFAGGQESGKWIECDSNVVADCETEASGMPCCMPETSRLNVKEYDDGRIVKCLGWWSLDMKDKIGEAETGQGGMCYNWKMHNYLQQEDISQDATYPDGTPISWTCGSM